MSTRSGSQSRYHAVVHELLLSGGSSKDEIPPNLLAPTQSRGVVAIKG